MASMTRKFLEALGIEDDKIGEILSRHGEVTAEIKAERDALQENADKLAAMTAERDKLQQQVDTLTKASGDVAQVQAEFDAYKASVASEKLNTTKGNLLRKALADKKANAQVVELLMHEIDLDKVEMDGDELKDADGVLAPIVEHYGAFFGTDGVKGTEPRNPPAGKNEPEDPYLVGFGD